MNRKLEVGMKSEITKKITEEDIIKFSEVSEDKNPIHLNEEYAKRSIFKERIAHGMLSASLISAVLGNKLPGEGSIYLEQNLKFIKPVFIGDIITARVEIISIEGKNIILETKCYNHENNIVLLGKAKILYQ